MKQSQEERKKELKKLTDQMNESVKQYQTNPADEMALLDSLSRFKDYSINNTLLARSQYQGCMSTVILSTQTNHP